MAEKLVDRRTLRGLDGAGVRRLLGSPGARVRVADTDRTQWIYEAGRGSHEIDAAELRLEFDRRGTLLRYSIVQG